VAGTVSGVLERTTGLGRDQASAAALLAGVGVVVLTALAAAAGPATTALTTTANAPATDEHLKRSIPTSLTRVRPDSPTPSPTAV